jgi:hypothetical protein
MAHAAGTHGDGGRGPTGHGLTRRGVLLSAAAVAAAGAAGVAAGVLRAVPVEHSHPPPPELVAALADEQRLLAGIDATTGGDEAVRTALRAIRADHAAHRDALQAAVRSSGGTLQGGPPPTATALTRAALRAAEQAASLRAAAHAAALTGEQAALLASIAASEASHAELLA